MNYDAPHLPVDALDLASRELLTRGIRVMQGGRMGATDEAHVAALLGYMHPDIGETVLDIGCGFGEVARLMQQQRPDLDFVLVNKNRFQLGHAPTKFRRVRADMHAMPISDATVDTAMFCYSLCHADPGVALMEAARVTRVGGQLFVYDFARLRGDNDLMERRLAARAISLGAMGQHAIKAGWMPSRLVSPDVDDTLFRDLYANDAEYDAIFADVCPVVWKAVRQ
jgi:ubiquinone/menaquinone biosynthesis C-methylase UbiE